MAIIQVGRYLAGPQVEDGVFYLVIDLGDQAWVHVGWHYELYHYVHRPISGFDIDDVDAISDLIGARIAEQR